jgi:4-hydroxy-tetrahydrodipicolinate reductase
MNIALIGYGRMGNEVAEMASKRGHAITLIIDIDNQNDLVAGKFSAIDAVIEFTSPEAAFGNVMKCMEMGVPVVSGSTGWVKEIGKVEAKCIESGTSFIHSSNFSVGVNILFRLNSELARIMGNYGDYSVSIEEIHHTKKLDAPSGTAITLADGIVSVNPDYDGWSFPENKTDTKIPITSVREGSVPGTHTIEWHSEIDKISLRHEAFGRKGFALGAVLAAEYISSRKGVFKMSDVLGF